MCVDLIIDESVLCIISDAFAAVKICTNYKANKILPDQKYTKQRIRNNIN